MLRNVLCSLTLCLLLCLRAAAQDRSTPEAAVRTFLAAFSSGDLKQAVTCVKGAQISGANLDALEKQVKKDPATFTLTDPKTTVNGMSATVTGQVSIKSARAEKAEEFMTEVTLVQSGETWLIVPDEAKARRETKPDLVNGLAYILAEPKALTIARDSARAVSCLSNMKQLCLGAIMFSQDWDEKFKLKAESYKKSIMPYVKNEGIFKCPSDSGAGSSYSFNANLAGISLAKIHAPAETVLLYEGKNGKLDFRHGGKAAVGFADGHAKLLDAAAAKKLRWKP